MPIYRLGSRPLVQAPGVIAWAINAFAFPRDRAVVTETWPGLEEAHARLLLSRDLPYRLEGDTIVLDVPETNDPAAKTKAAAVGTACRTREAGR